MSSSLKDVLTAETERWQRIWKTRKVGKGAAAATALARSGEAGAVPRTRKSRPRWRDASGKCSVYVFFGEPFWTTNSDRMYVQRHRMVEKWHFGKNALRMKERSHNWQNVFNLDIGVGVVPQKRKFGRTRKRPPDKMENRTMSLQLWVSEFARTAPPVLNKK